MEEYDFSYVGNRKLSCVQNRKSSWSFIGIYCKILTNKTREKNFQQICPGYIVWIISINTQTKSHALSDIMLCLESLTTIFSI